MIFFNKKYYAADLLEGLVDMHCHILPNIDDGAKDNNMALEMLKQYKGLGYTGLIATPHIMKGVYDNTASEITETSKRFQSTAAENGYTDFSISHAAEYMMDDGFDKLIATKELLPVIGNKVLVEMSYLQSSFQPFEQIFQLKQQDFEPILAHPERYSYLTNVSEVLAFKTNGCSLQLNLLSLGGHYGKQVTQKAIALLENGHYEYMGTDAHHPGHFSVLKRIVLSKKILPHFETLISRTKENLLD